MSGERAPDGSSFRLDRRENNRWPRRRVIWSCQEERGPLLTRYFLFQTRCVGLYLHCLHSSDEDRALHDHPWSFVTFLFHRGYHEHTPSGRFWRRRFSVLWRPAEWQHRLEVSQPTWTLVLRLRRRREWGFWLPTGWLDWRAYGKEWCD
jgi:hypothetical protein